MDEGIPTPDSAGLKPKLEIQPCSESEVWVALESERMFNGREEIGAYLETIADQIRAALPEEILSRRIFITRVGKHIRIQTGGARDFKTEELEKIKAIVAGLNI